MTAKRKATSTNMESASTVESFSKTNKKTHCINGHEFTSENSYFTPKGVRQCRTCKREATYLSRFNSFKKKVLDIQHMV